MSGGVVQLVATGIQDVHLTGNPEVSFFRSNFKRHTQFAMSNELQLLQGSPSPGGVSTVRFEKKGDLLGYTYLMIKDNSVSPGGIIKPSSDYNGWGSIISKVDLLIGGQVIDTQDVFFSNTIAPSFMSSTISTRFTNGSLHFLPFQFFFCKEFQSAIPLVSLSYHDVELQITWASNYSLSSSVEFRLFSNFVYLDSDERKFFAEKPIDLLIQQVQRVVAQPNYYQDIVFNHPVKFIAFPCVRYLDPRHTLKLQVNGVDIGVEKPLIHFSQVNPYYHTSLGWDPAVYPQNNPIALIPFCLDTSKLQPTGTLNFSRIDTFRLITSTSNTIGGAGNTSNIVDIPRSQFIYAVNYNVLRIRSGMGALLYSS